MNSLSLTNETIMGLLRDVQAMKAERRKSRFPGWYDELIAAAQAEVTWLVRFREGVRDEKRAA
jgi:hypothetical protein